MKKVILIVAAVVSTIAMQSCRQKNTLVVESGSAIEVSADVAGVVSKASKTAFAANDTFGMWVVPYVKAGLPSTLYPVDNYADNVLYKHDGIDFKTTDLVVYPSSDAEVDLYAVAPYQRMMSAQIGNTMTDPQAYPWRVKQQQTGADSVVLSDIMTSFHKGAKQGAVPVLQFNHRLSQVLIKFKVPQLYNKFPVSSVKKVELMGLRLNSTINIADTAAVPVVVANDATNPRVNIETFCSVKPAGQNVVAGDYVYEAIVVPQSVATGDYIVRITLNVTYFGDVVFDCKTSAAYAYEPKKSTVLNINIGSQTEILVGDVSISAWQNATDVAGNTIQLSKIIFNILNLDNVTNLGRAKVAKLNISDSLYEGRVTYDATNSKYIIEYDPRLNFKGYLKQIEITDGESTPTSIVPKTTLLEPGYQIKGDPSSSTYAISIGTIVFRGSAVEIYNSHIKNFVDNSAADAASNCYVIESNQVLIFNAKVKGHSAVPIDPTAVRLVWQTAQDEVNIINGDNLVIGYNDNVKYNKSTGLVSVAASNVGNAVVAAYDANNNILWSWHIWVSSKALANIPRSIYNTGTFEAANGAGKSILDRNLGAADDLRWAGDSKTFGFALTGGMLYQWGRKDPFVGMAGINSNNATRIYDHLGSQIDYKVVRNNLDNTTSLDNMTLFYNSTNSDNWTNAKNDNLWTSAVATNLVVNNQGAKSINDPCPVGYRVATGGKDGMGTWGALGVNGTGYNSKVWIDFDLKSKCEITEAMLTGAPVYPAAGLRDAYGYRGASTLVAVWSASVSGESALGLNIDAKKFYPNTLMGRSTACAVRCVEE